MKQVIKYTPTSEKMDEYDLREVAELNIKTLWIEYNYGYYEGIGYLIAKDYDGKFFFKDLSHCSCYGPYDDMAAAMKEKYATFPALLEKCTREVADSLKRIKREAR